jgi:hypothetical protein
MSDVKSSAKSGKSAKQVSMSFKGAITAAQWAEFKQQVKALASRSGLTIATTKEPKKRATKK